MVMKIIVKSLIHVTDDVERFGVLDNFSAFPGENNLPSIKRMLRSGFKPLQQIVKRIFERESVENLSAEVSETFGLHKNTLQLEGLRLDLSDRNRWILTKNNNIFKVKEFTQRDSKIEIHVANLDNKHKKKLVH